MTIIIDLIKKTSQKLCQIGAGSFDSYLGKTARAQGLVWLYHTSFSIHGLKRGKK